MKFDFHRMASTTGCLYDITTSPPTFLGTCFGFQHQFAALTAAHVVRGLAPSNLRVALFQSGPSQGLRVNRVIPHEHVDVAMIEMGNRNPVFAEPLMLAHGEGGWGAKVISYGFPQISTSTGLVPEGRVFRGHIQRYFDHEDGDYRFKAIETSFASPLGLSGAAIVSEKRPTEVFAVVSGNVQTESDRTLIREFREGSISEIETTALVLRYTVAARLDQVHSWLLSCLS